MDASTGRSLSITVLRVLAAMALLATGPAAAQRVSLAALQAQIN